VLHVLPKKNGESFNRWMMIYDSNESGFALAHSDIQIQLALGKKAKPFKKLGQAANESKAETKGVTRSCKHHGTSGSI